MASAWHKCSGYRLGGQQVTLADLHNLADAAEDDWCSHQFPGINVDKY